ncbi:Patched domain-containing protein 3 [Armadillidium vulgare]|nr:Patched domain-containing protein 3 [Armadillidium vulgare]
MKGLTAWGVSFVASWMLLAAELYQNSGKTVYSGYIVRIHGFARVLIEPKDKGSIFRKFLWKEILEINQAVKNISITYEGREYGYKDMCAVWNKNCSENAVLDLYDEVDAIENKTMKINYPLMIFPFVIPMFFGGITLDQNRLYIKSATAINLAYFLRVDTPEQIERASIWEQEFISTIGNMTFEHLHVSYSAARSIQDATNETPQAVKPFIPIVVLIMILFSVGNTMMFDWVRSKIYLGLIGLSSAALATGASFGYLMYFGIANSGINNIIPFLMIGIALMTCSWYSPPGENPSTDSVVKRLGNTYANAGISVLITSLTNMVSFLIGTTAPIYSIRLFSLYTDSKNVCYSFWCSGGINPSDPWNPIDNQQNSVMLFFRDYFVLVIVCFSIYISGAVYGFLRISEAYDRMNSVRYDSYIADYIRMEDTLFRHHTYSIQVMITGDLKYSDEATRQEIIKLHEAFENLTYVASPALTQSWMRSWFRRLKRKVSLRNVSTEEEFIKELRETFLHGEGNSKYFDVVYNENFTRIIASRFFIQTGEIKDTEVDAQMMNEMRRVAEDSPLNVTVFNPNFMYFDQYNLVKPAVTEATAIAALSMILISLVLIPNKWCSLYVGFAIVSIELGVIGYMSLWNVSLNFISMISLIMCIGFSVGLSRLTFPILIILQRRKLPTRKLWSVYTVWVYQFFREVYQLYVA